MGNTPLCKGFEDFEEAYAGPHTKHLEAKAEENRGRQDDFCIVCCKSDLEVDLFPQLSPQEIHYCPRRFCKGCLKYIPDNWYRTSKQEVVEKENFQYSYYPLCCPLCQLRGWENINPFLGPTNKLWTNLEKNVATSIRMLRWEVWETQVNTDYWYTKNKHLSQSDEWSVESDQYILKHLQAFRAECDWDGAIIKKTARFGQPPPQSPPGPCESKSGMLPSYKIPCNEEAVYSSGCQYLIREMLSDLQKEEFYDFKFPPLPQTTNLLESFNRTFYNSFRRLTDSEASTTTSDDDRNISRAMHSVSFEPTSHDPSPIAESPVCISPDVAAVQASTSRGADDNQASKKRKASEISTNLSAASTVADFDREAEIRTLRRANNDLVDEFREIDNKLQRRNSKIDHLEEEITALEIHNEKIREQLSMETKECETLRAQLKALEVEKAGFAPAVTRSLELELQVARQKKAIAALQVAKKDAELALESSQGCQRRSEDDVVALRNEKENAEKYVADLQGRVDELEIRNSELLDLDDQRQRLSDSLKARFRDAKTANRSLQGSSSALSEQNAKLLTETSQQRQQLLTMTVQLHELHESNAKLLTESSNLRKEQLALTAQLHECNEMAETISEWKAELQLKLRDEKMTTSTVKQVCAALAFELAEIRQVDFEDLSNEQLAENLCSGRVSRQTVKRLLKSEDHRRLVDSIRPQQA